MDNHIDWKDVEGHWSDYKDHVKDKWKKLTDDDLTKIKGDRHRLMSALQERYGMAKEKIEEQVSEFFSNAGDWMEEAKDKVTDAMARGGKYVLDHSMTEMADDVKQLICRYPLRSVLLGLGVGYFVGRFMTGSNRS